MLKTILIIIIFGACMTILGQLIPPQIGTNINGAFVYFLSQINSLRAFSVPITTAIITSLQILGNYFVAVGLFLVIRWILALSA